jgi:hypothetical protein
MNDNDSNEPNPFLKARLSPKERDQCCTCSIFDEDLPAGGLVVT